MSFDSFFHGVTTKIDVIYNKDKKSFGTGFFFFSLESTIYEEYEKVKPKIYCGETFHDIKSMWLITNRHVVLPQKDELEYLPEMLIFSLRKREGANISWVPIVICREQLIDRLYLHKDSTIDVACVRIGDLILERALHTDNLIETEKARISLLLYQV